MNERPKLKIIPTRVDQGLELAATFLLATMWTYILLNFSSLPDIIPTHFDAKGEVNGQGGKEMLFILAGIATFFYIGLTILNRYPHVFNYPTTFTAENAYHHYSKATRFMRVLKIVLVFIFLFITWKTVNVAQGKASGVGPEFLPLVVGIIFIPVGWYLFVSLRKK